MTYIIETPKKSLKISIKIIEFNATGLGLGTIKRYRAKCGKVEAGGKTEKAAYFNLLKLLIKNMDTGV